ncbi:unnamed protein product [Caenorhabditis sp. 36 PRJEB53466]|nr:unnamed protein product [Caenorhabditis sp. 36 PRJEB53466]
MGITGLWKIVEPTATEIPLECLEGKKLAVDVSIWIYQAQMAYPSDQPYPHLRLLVNRLSKLLFYKIRPVFVFDGPQVPSLKRKVIEGRRQKREDEDDILKNAKKMRQLKEIASGKLDDVELAKRIDGVCSPSKKTVQNDVYKDIPSSSIDLRAVDAAGRAQTDRFNYIESSDDDDVIEIKKEEKVQIPAAARRVQMQGLLDKREVMRNSRLRPDMIPSDSKSFSNFQMQRLLQRGRLSAQIQQLANSSASIGGSTPSDKINVTGPDGTRHVLRHAFSDEIQEVKAGQTREIDNLYKPSGLEMTLDVFNVEYGGRALSREATPDDEREEFVEKMEERLMDRKEGWTSKSAMLEVIARKRIRLHYGAKEGEEEKEREKELELEVSDDEMALQEVLLESASKGIDEKMEKEWDPQRYDPPSTSTNHYDDDYIRLNYDDDDRTPQLYRDLQEFLTNCGVPWIEAPGEAEAQCVELETLGLVDGVVSDDSDVWAFGVRHVYRHMFAKTKRVQRYGERTAGNKENCRLFCLQREDFIAIAMLSGGDYCSGLSKVGTIGALELVSEFVEQQKEEQKEKKEEMEDAENRIMRLLSKVRHLFVSSPEEARRASRTAMQMRRHVTEANERDTIEMVCSNREAVHAYLHPLVDRSTEHFRWRPMNIPLVRSTLQQRLNWPDRSQQHEEKNSFDAFEKWNVFLREEHGRSQMRLDRFFAQKTDSSLELKWSKRVIEAMKRIEKRRKGEEEEVEEIPMEESKKGSPKKTATRGRGRGRGREHGPGSTLSTKLMRSLHEHERIPPDESLLRCISNNPIEAMKAEWMRCPRCKTKQLKPEVISTDKNGSDKLWWICENYAKCMFPLDMPPKIYHVTQTACQKRDGYVPLPKIQSIPSKYRYMYPITFSDSRPPSRCSSTAFTKTGSRTSSDATNARSTNSVITTSSGVASTSDPSETIGDQDNIDDELEAAAKKPETCRVVKKRVRDSSRSWSSLLEKLASDPVAANTIINMEESELFHRMKEFFDDQYYRGTAIVFRRHATRRVTYRVDDVENCLRAITHDDWESAKKRMTVNTRGVMQSANAQELLKTVGIDLENVKKAVQQKVTNVMSGFSQERLVKRRKLEENRQADKAARKESLQNEIHLSVSARILNKKMRKEDEERSRTCTPAPSCSSEPANLSYFESSSREEHQPSQPVHFQVENGEETDHNWGFDLDGLYESIHAQNNQFPADEHSNDPYDAMLFQLDDSAPNNEAQPQNAEPLVDQSGERTHVEQDEYSGFDDFSGLADSTYDFMDYEVCRKVWESQVPVQFTIQSGSPMGDPLPYYTMLPRFSYLALCLPKVLSYFDRREDGEKVQGEKNLEDDAILEFNVRTSTPPAEFMAVDRNMMETMFMQSIKEADYLKTKAETTNNMQKEEYSQLWRSVANNNFDEFWTIIQKLMETKDGKEFDHIPLRVYVKKQPFKQILISAKDDAGSLRTLGEAVNEVLKTSDDGASSEEERHLISHGIDVPAHTPLIFAAKNLSYPDNFVHIAVL